MRGNFDVPYCFSFFTVSDIAYFGLVGISREKIDYSLHYPTWGRLARMNSGGNYNSFLTSRFFVERRCRDSQVINPVARQCAAQEAQFCETSFRRIDGNFRQIFLYTRVKLGEFEFFVFRFFSCSCKLLNFVPASRCRCTDSNGRDKQCRDCVENKCWTLMCVSLVLRPWNDVSFIGCDYVQIWEALTRMSRFCSNLYFHHIFANQWTSRRHPWLSTAEVSVLRCINYPLCRDLR